MAYEDNQNENPLPAGDKKTGFKSNNLLPKNFLFFVVLKYLGNKLLDLKPVFLSPAGNGFSFWLSS